MYGICRWACLTGKEFKSDVITSVSLIDKNAKYFRIQYAHFIYKICFSLSFDVEKWRHYFCQIIIYEFSCEFEGKLLKGIFTKLFKSEDLFHYALQPQKKQGNTMRRKIFLLVTIWDIFGLSTIWLNFFVKSFPPFCMSRSFSHCWEIKLSWSDKY